MPYEVELYTDANGGCPLDDFLDQMPMKHKAKVQKFVQVLEEQGPGLPRPYADVLDGPIRELRVPFGNLQYRIFYFFYGKVIIMTHGMIKKTGPVPVGEIERAKRFMTHWLDRYTKRRRP